MMMEEEIERTKEEIRGIKDACEKVEQVLAKVIQGGYTDGSLEDNVDGYAVKREDEEKMEDVQQTESNEIAAPEPVEVDSKKWYEDENLLNLWNRTDNVY